MYCLKFRDSSSSHDLLLFNEYDSALEFIEAFPYLQHEHYEYDGIKFDEYYFYVKDLPDYFEWQLGGRYIPMTKYSFVDERIDLEIHEIDHFNAKEESIVDGGTKVDAWIINNEDVKEYVLNREALAQEIIKQLDNLSYTDIQRSFYGSEDGEAIMASKGSDQSFFTHLDPFLVDGFTKSDMTLEDYVKQEIENNH